jgi:hypothetical protein
VWRLCEVVVVLFFFVLMFFFRENGESSKRLGTARSYVRPSVRARRERRERRQRREEGGGRGGRCGRRRSVPRLLLVGAMEGRGERGRWGGRHIFAICC